MSDADGELFRKILDEYQVQLVRTPTPCKPEAVPDLDWPGWASACQRVDICGNVPTLRLRQAVKLARAADEAHLRGMGVDWPVVHSRLASICSGFMSMSQLPSTVQEEENLQEIHVEILYHEKPVSGKRLAMYYVVLTNQHPADGEWMSCESLTELLGKEKTAALMAAYRQLKRERRRPGAGSDERLASVPLLDKRELIDLGRVPLCAPAPARGDAPSATLAALRRPERALTGSRAHNAAAGAPTALECKVEPADENCLSQKRGREDTCQGPAPGSVFGVGSSWKHPLLPDWLWRDAAAPGAPLAAGPAPSDPGSPAPAGELGASPAEHEDDWLSAAKWEQARIEKLSRAKSGEGCEAKIAWRCPESGQVLHTDRISVQVLKRHAHTMRSLIDHYEVLTVPKRKALQGN